MRRLALFSAAVAVGCASEIGSLDSAEPEGMGEMGEISGVVTRSAEVQGDGIGNVIVLVFYGVSPAVDRSPHNALVLPYEDLSQPGAEVAYRIQNLFPEPEPYTVLAVFDEDDSLMDSMDWVPTEGDLLSSALDSGDSPVVLIGQDVACDLTLDLSVVYRD